MRKVEIGGIYEHFKRPEDTNTNDGSYRYIVIDIAHHTETKEELVIYKALYPPYATYARPIQMFLGLVDENKYPECKRTFRFTKVNLRGTANKE